MSITYMKMLENNLYVLYAECIQNKNFIIGPIVFSYMGCRKMKLPRGQLYKAAGRSLLPTETALFQSSHGKLCLLAAIWPLHMLNPQGSTMQQYD